MNAKLKKCKVSNCINSKSQTPSSNPTKNQIATFCQNPKVSNLLSNAKRVTQAVKEKKIWEDIKAKSTKAVKKR